MDPFIRTETCFVQAEKKARNPGKVMLSCGHQISNQPWPLCHWVEDRVPRYQWTQWLPPSDVGGGGGGRGQVLGLSWAAGGSPRLGFSRWEFQPPMWRNGSRVDQSPFQGCCGRFYWVLGQRLLKETAGDQERRGIAQREVLTAYAWQERATRKSMGRAWGRADQSSREPGHVKCPLPGPQSSHLKNGSRQHD